MRHNLETVSHCISADEQVCELVLQDMPVDLNVPPEFDIALNDAIVLLRIAREKVNTALRLLP